MLPLAFTVFGKNLAIQAWNTSAAIPVLALHGWYDNSASFQLLAGLLPECAIVAPDLAGHGHSDYRSADAAYNIWQDVGELAQLTENLGWQQFVVIGHSRGANIATLFAATFPEKVSKLILLDGFVPKPSEPALAPSVLAESIADKHRLLDAPRRYYASREEALQTRQRGMLKLTRPAAEAIAERGLAHNQSGYFWRADPRLRGASELRLSRAYIEAFVARIACPTLIFSAQLGESDLWQELAARNGNITIEHCPAASHHLHMEGDIAGVAEIIRDFLSVNTG